MWHSASRRLKRNDRTSCFPVPVFKSVNFGSRLFLLDLSMGTIQARRAKNQEKLFIWPPFFQYNKRLLRQKTGGACGMLVYMPKGWSLASHFWSYPLPPKSCLLIVIGNSSWPLKLLFLIEYFTPKWRFGGGRKSGHSSLDSRAQQAPSPD